MWDLGNRGSVVLISLTFGCVLVYNAWGAILALAFTLFLVVYACYSLLVNDSLVSPNAYHVLAYLREAVHELGVAIHIACSYGIGPVRNLWYSARRCYRERFPFRMERRRANNYQLSSDSYAAAGNAMFKRKDSSPSSSSLSLSRLGINQLSPIPRVAYSGKIDRGPVYVNDHSRTGQERRFSKYTSTPLRFNDQEEDSRNRDVELTSQSPEIHTNKITYAQNHTLSRGENMTMFSPKGSPWGMSISPKMRPRPAGVKTVQTVAGPLLASTRYNIDPKVLTDVSSPGLTMRLTKYATQADANSKLTHQPQYGTGQFPKVNMHANPIPLLNAKLRKMRLPVTVRVAPPDIAKYSPPERQKILSNICHVENKSPTSVVQVLREISLKRHASMEDVSFDVAKKQKTEGFFNEEREMVIEENKQKRGRNDSSISDEDLSPLSKSLRPAKRTKTRSCYDILNSLSSSIHVPVGIKRKAADFSRCGTPDFEKHFKSLESAQPSNSPTVPKFVNLDAELKIYSRSPEAVNKKTEDFPLVKGILKSSRESRANLNKVVPVGHKTAKTVTTKVDDKPTKPINLTDKLFMRAEPEQNEQLKLLVEEPGNIKAKFATDNVEEIKRDDIRNMRQTSMKARLKSMFDAISGKGENKINPDVVIQADDVNAVTSPITCPVTCATLNSSTTTTNVVTTPLSTAAVAPQGFSSSSKSDTKVDAKPTTTFSLPTAISPQTNVSATQSPVRSTTFELKAANSTTVTSDQTKVVSTAPTTTSTGFLQKTQASSSIPSPVSILTFGHEKSAATTTAVTSTSSSSSFSTSVPSSTTFESVAVTTTPLSITSSTSTNFLTVNKTPTSLTFTPISSSVTLGAKVETNNVVATTATISSPITANTQVNPIFAFGGGKLSLSPATSTQTSTSNLLPQTTGTTLLVNTTTASLAGFNNVTNTGTLNNVALTTSAAPALFTFESNNVTSQPSKSGTFIFGQSNTTQKEPNTFGNPSSNQPTSLPQVTTKSYNFTSNTLAPTSSSFTASIASFNSVANNATSSSVATITSAAPSLFTFGNNSTTLQSPKSDTFMFGQSNSAQKETNAFGNSASSQATTTLPQVTTKSFNFTSNTPTSNSFTSTNSAFTATTTATPAFNSPSAPTFSLGASITSSTSSISKPVFVFGAANTPSTASTPVALPAAPAPSTTGFGTTSNTAVPIFGATTAAAIPQFGASITTVPQFGTPTTSIFATSSSTITTTNIFGSTSQPLFGTTSPVPGTSTVFSPKTTAPSIFAPTTNVVSTSNNTVSPALFANVNVPPTSTTTSSSVFGSGSPIFGQTKPTTSFGTSSAGAMFGTTTPLFGSNTQTTTAPTFGITGNTSTNTIAPGFDTANDTPTVFGTPNSATVTSAQTTPAFSATTGMFGPTDNNASSVPIFGANAAPSPGAFGTAPATNTFGTPNLAFGSTSGNSTFGDNKSPFGAPPVSTTGFGTPSTSISSFGAGNNANNPGNSTSNMFVFGSNQKDGQQNPTFSFGSNFTAGSNNPTTAASTSFQFGATSSKPATSGFNFSTNSLSATPTLNFGATSMPTFNPSTPGMFSIGSGSTAPRSRSIRTRKPR